MPCVSGILPGILPSMLASDPHSFNKDVLHEDMGESRHRRRSSMSRRSSIGRRSSMSRRSSMRRLSQSFRDACQLDSDDDFFSMVDSDEAWEYESCDSCVSSPRSVLRFASFRIFDDSESRCGSDIGRDREEQFFKLNSSDSEDECSWRDDAIEEMYDFDMEKVAEAVRRGAGQEELQELIAEHMAANLESLMQMPPPLASLSEPSPLMAGDLAGRMTPPLGVEQSAATAAALAGRTTPPVGSETAQVSPAAELASRLADLQSPPSIKCSRRRSSMTTPHGRRMSQAMMSAHAEHRRSICKAMAAELAASEPHEVDTRGRQEVLQAVNQCAKNAIRQHRLSLMQAAEVLEAAGFGEEQDHASSSTSQVRMQLEMVQKALDGARKQHRQSIQTAVRSVKAEHISESPASGSAQEKVQKIINTALRAEPSRSDNHYAPKRQQRFKDRFTPQSLIALMHTRTSEKGMPVHCGPAQRGAKNKRGGC